MSAPSDRLAAEREAVLSRIESLQQDVASILGSADATTGDDEHDPEGATIGFERAQAIGMLDEARDHLAEIDAAIARLRAGSYGSCVRCGRPIAAERLEARPEAALCIACASHR